MLSVAGLRLEMNREQVLEIMGPPNGNREQLELTILTWSSPQTSVVLRGDKVVSIGGSPLVIDGKTFCAGDRVEQVEQVLGNPDRVIVGRKYDFKDSVVEITVGIGVTEDNGIIKGFYLRRLEDDWSAKEVRP